MLGKNRLRLLALWALIAAGGWTAGSAGMALLGPGRAEAARGERRGGVIVVGAVLDLSGKGAARGREARDALLLEEERINGREGGIGGRSVFLVTMDSGGEPSSAADAVRRLSRGYGAVAIIGPSESTAALAAAGAAERAGVPLLSLAAPEPLLDPVRRWVFSTAQPPALAVRRILLHMRSRGVRRAAVLASPDRFGAEGRKQLSALAPEMGVSILLNEPYAPGEYNFLPFLQRAHLRGAEAFVHWALGASQVALVRARVALVLGLPIYMATAASRAFDLKEGGRAAEGVVFPAARLLAAELLPDGTPGLRRIKEFRAAFRERFERAPDGLAGYAADALRLLAVALRVGGPHRARIRKIIEETRHLVGLTGRFRFSESDHNGLGPDSFVMVRIRGGRWTLEGGPSKGKKARR